MANLIIMLAGLPGTGKSTTTKRLEDRLGYDLHSLLGIRRDFGHKRYRPEQNPNVFEELYRRTKKSLQRGRGVILDNTYTTQEGRQLVYEISKDYGVDVFILECYCSEKEAKRRIKQRPISDGLVVEPRDPKVYGDLARRWQDIAQDLVKFRDYPISYVRYDTEKNTVEEVRVDERVKFVVNMINSA